MVIKKSPGGESAGGGGAVNFEIHLCSSGMISDCIWRSISIQYVQIEAGVNYDLVNGSFWVEIRDAKHVAGIFLGTIQLAYRLQKLGRSPSPATGVRGHAPPGNF